MPLMLNAATPVGAVSSTMTSSSFSVCLFHQYLTCWTSRSQNEDIHIDYTCESHHYIIICLVWNSLSIKIRQLPFVSQCDPPFSPCQMKPRLYSTLGARPAAPDVQASVQVQCSIACRGLCTCGPSLYVALCRFLEWFDVKCGYWYRF